MKILLDTHILLWAVSFPEKLPDPWRMELETRANEVFVSAVSIAEIMIKSSIGKLAIRFDPVQAALESGFEVLDFSGADALPLKDLPFHHRDPFDRMLVAQALVRKLSLMITDSIFAHYDCKLVRHT